ncbi:hypothetical protein MYX65_11650 [Acidobacteria bacterium AH-259-L09]|nr:hypothetical protein [Acidobacteria bacterium AH-259-L09]
MPKTLVSTEKLRHVNNHLTPLAVLIVVPGLIVVPLPKLAVVVGGILIAYSVSINYLSIYLVKRDIRFIATVRVGSNYSVNIFLLWLLYSTWPPVWTLLLLMSIGVAVYQNRRDSFLCSLTLAWVLLVVHWSFGVHSLQAWAIVGVEASIIILFSLFVNGLLEATPERQEMLVEEDS